MLEDMEIDTLDLSLLVIRSGLKLRCKYVVSAMADQLDPLPLHCSKSLTPSLSALGISTAFAFHASMALLSKCTSLLQTGAARVEVCSCLDFLPNLRLQSKGISIKACVISKS